LAHNLVAALQPLPVLGESFSKAGHRFDPQRGFAAEILQHRERVAFESSGGRHGGAVGTESVAAFADCFEPVHARVGAARARRGELTYRVAGDEVRALLAAFDARVDRDAVARAELDSLASPGPAALHALKKRISGERKSEHARGQGWNQGCHDRSV